MLWRGQGLPADTSWCLLVMSVVELLFSVFPLASLGKDNTTMM